MADPAVLPVRLAFAAARPLVLASFVARMSLGAVVRICLIFVGKNGAAGVAATDAGAWGPDLGRFVPESVGLTSQGAERTGSAEHDSDKRSIPWALDCNNLWVISMQFTRNMRTHVER